MYIPRVLVLMSTYNGQRFLNEQIDSILSQRGVDVHLLVRDDGSSDSTPEILSAYQGNFPNVEVLLEENIGCKYSFAKLCRIALERYPDYDYFAFSDQDDVWMEDKLYSASSKLDECVENQGRLYFCSWQLVDAELRPIPTSYRRYRLTLGESILIQPAAGCTMLFDVELLRKFCIAPPSFMHLHDSWMYKMCLATGGKVVFDSVPHIMYRQHGNNVVGGNQSLLQKWRRRWRYYSNAERLRSKMAKNIYSVYRDFLTIEAKNMFSKIVMYNSSFKSKIYVLLSRDIRCNNSMNNFLFLIAILTNRF